MLNQVVRNDIVATLNRHEMFEAPGGEDFDCSCGFESDDQDGVKVTFAEHLAAALEEEVPLFAGLSENRVENLMMVDGNVRSVVRSSFSSGFSIIAPEVAVAAERAGRVRYL